MNILILANSQFYDNKNYSIENNDAEYEQINALIAFCCHRCIDDCGFVTNKYFPNAVNETAAKLNIDTDRATEIARAIYSRLIGASSVMMMWVRIMSVLTGHPWWYCHGIDTDAAKYVDIFWDESKMDHDAAVAAAKEAYPSIA